MLLRHRVGVERVLAPQIQPLHDGIDHLLPCRTELLGSGSQEYGAISGEICVERLADPSQRVGPGVVNRRTNVPAPKAGDMVKPPDDVIRAHGAKQEHIQGQGSGTDVAVPEHEAAEQPGLRTVGGVGRVLGHEVEHAVGQLVVVDPRVPR